MSFEELSQSTPEGVSEKEKQDKPEVFHAGETSKQKQRKGLEYLRSDIRPIMACVGTYDDLKGSPYLEEIDKSKREFSLPGKERVHNVDYYDSSKNFRLKNFRNQGFQTYVISSIDSKNKFSNEFKNCTGLVVAGKDKETGENISFLSHQDPDYFLATKENKDEFVNDLSDQIEEIKKRCEEGTIDAKIVGGNAFGKEYLEGEHRKEYIESIKLLSSEVSSLLGFEPVAVMGPKAVGGEDDVFYDNEHRRLYIIRPVLGDETSNPVSVKNIEEQDKKRPTTRGDK